MRKEKTIRQNHFIKSLDSIVMVIIVLYSTALFLGSYYPHSKILYAIDLFCCVFFIAEMVVKMQLLGLKGYWKNGWNRLDGTLVLLSVPSLFAALWPVTDLSFLLIFRLLRVFLLFRVVHLFPHAKQIGKNFVKGLKASSSLFLGYFIVVCIFALLTTSLFGHSAPQYFGTPVESLYSIFRLFTVEGWYEIPDAVTEGYSEWGVILTRLYFIFLLILGGIIGLSLINSVFVDAMVSDNNDDVKEQLKRLENKIDMILSERNKDKGDESA